MAGLLSDVLPYLYSQGDRAKRYVGGLLSDPMGSLEQTAGLLGDKHREAQELQAKAFSNPQRPFQLTDVGALKQMIDNTMAGPMGFAPAGMTAWHGSPYKFDKFDSSKIGTGEGAQAYGHGTYFAENPAVSQSYINAGRSDLAKFEPTDEARQLFKKNFPTGKAQVGKLHGITEDTLATWVQSPTGLGDEIRAALPADLLAAYSKATPRGNLYKVDLPDTAVAKMLDWDKPLSQQPDAFKQAVSRREQERMMPILAQRKATLASLPTDSQMAPNLQKQIAILEEEIATKQPVPNMTGGEYFNYLRRREMKPEDQAKWLKDAGIPGIRYLDGGSRGAGQGSSNFVVFPGEESLLQILERNGQALK